MPLSNSAGPGRAPMITDIIASDGWAWRAADGTKHILLIPVSGFVRGRG